MAPPDAGVTRTDPTVNIEVLTGTRDLISQVETEWRALCDESADTEPFYRPEVIRAYVDAFAPDRRVVIFTARIEQRLVAALPMVQDVSFRCGVPVRTLRTAGNVHTYRYNLVHIPEFRTAIVSALWRALKKSRGWDVLELSALPVHSALTSLVHTARMDGFSTHAIRA